MISHDREVQGYSMAGSSSVAGYLSLSITSLSSSGLALFSDGLSLCGIP